MLTELQKYNVLLSLPNINRRYMFAGKNANVQDVVISRAGVELAQKTTIGKGKKQQVSVYITLDGENLIAASNAASQEG